MADKEKAAVESTLVVYDRVVTTALSQRRSTAPIVSVTGRRATLVTCWDPTDADLVNVSAGPVQKVEPAAPNVTTFHLARSGGGWRISRRTAGRPC